MLGIECCVDGGSAPPRKMVVWRNSDRHLYCSIATTGRDMSDRPRLSAIELWVLEALAFMRVPAYMLTLRGDAFEEYFNMSAAPTASANEVRRSVRRLTGLGFVKAERRSDGAVWAATEATARMGVAAIEPRLRLTERGGAVWLKFNFRNWRDFAVWQYESDEQSVIVTGRDLEFVRREVRRALPHRARGAEIATCREYKIEKWRETYWVREHSAFRICVKFTRSMRMARFLETAKGRPYRYTRLGDSLSRFEPRERWNGCELSDA